MEKKKSQHHHQQQPIWVLKCGIRTNVFIYLFVQISSGMHAPIRFLNVKCAPPYYELFEILNLIEYKMTSLFDSLGKIYYSFNRFCFSLNYLLSFSLSLHWFYFQGKSHKFYAVDTNLLIWLFVASNAMV